MVNVADYVSEGNILYAKEVFAFLSSFYAENNDETLNRVFAVAHDEWTNKGFVSLQELRKHICHSLMADENNSFVDKAKKNLVDKLVDGAIQKDKLTGFYAKTDCPLVTGLADLYRRTTGHNVFRIDGDFSNMGGTNEFFRHELESRGWGRRDSDGFQYTDRLVSISSRMMYDTISKAVSRYNSEGNTPRAYVHPFRSGGDEIRFIVTGIGRDTANVFVSECDKKMKEFIDKNHLNTHNNPKDPRRPGFGFEMALIPLTNNSLNSGAEADRIISIKKLLTSTENLYKKAAQIPRTEAEQYLAMVDSINSELNKYISADLRDRGYSEDSIAKAMHEREKVAQIKKEKALASNETAPDKGAVLTIVENMDKDLAYSSLLTLSPVPDGASIPILYGRDDFFADINSIRERSVAAWAKNLLIKNDADLHMINGLAKNYSSIDSATGVKMASALYNVMSRNPEGATDYDIDRFVKDVSILQGERGQSQSSQVKLAHIEFGNLAGMNCISHDFGDSLLKEYAGIIKKTLKEAGIEDEHAHAIYSEGGGKFKFALPEYYETKDKDGNISSHHIDDKLMEGITEKIKATVEKEINGKTVAEYCESHGLGCDFSTVTDKKLQAVLANPDAKIANIPNPKRISEFGISVVSAVTSINDNENASVQLNRFTNDFESSLRLARDKRERQAIRAERVADYKLSLSNNNSAEETVTQKYNLRRIADIRKYTGADRR